MTPKELLLKIAKILENLKIPYIVTGGFAATVWGKPRYTADIDIVIELPLEELSEFIKNLLSIGENIYVDEEMIKKAAKKKKEFNIIDPTTGFKVDFWPAKGEFEKLKITKGISKKINGQKVIFITPEDLILSKLKWLKISYSEKQLEDIKSILEISKPDLNYIKNWAKKQSTIKILKNCLNKNGDYSKH